MKVSFLLTALVAFCTQTISADNVANFHIGMTAVRIQTTQEKVFSLQLDRTKTDETIRIKIQNDASEVIFEETLLGAAAYTKRYSLQNLNTGDYSLIVEKATVTVLHPFELNRTGISVGEQPNRTFYAPSIKQIGNLLNVQITLDQPDNIKMLILDASANVLLSERHSNVSTLGKSYNLQLPEGKYTLLIYMQGKMYTENLTVAPLQVP